MMTDEEYIKIGENCRDAVDGNLFIGSFAAELAGESYPFSKAMAAVIFSSYSNFELGKKFERWIKETDR